MYAYLKGIVEDIESDKIVLDVNDIGYNIFPSSSLYSSIRTLGEKIKVYTYLHVKEDAMNIYGFSNKNELTLFKLLISVNGVGPRGALGILSIMSTEDLRFAIISGDHKFISKAPGIGSKTASKIILDLKDKIKIDDVLQHSTNLSDSESKDHSILEEAILALTSLGYSQMDASRAVRQCDTRESMNVEDLIKSALKKLI